MAATMTLRVLLLASFLIFTACNSPAFIVTEDDRRFSESKNQLFVSQNNRISKKSIAGGIHIDDAGLYVDPFVERNAESGAIELVGFNLVNKTNYDTLMGDPNSLGSINEIVFLLPDSSTVRLHAAGQETRAEDTITYNTVGRYAGYDRWESAVVIIDVDSYARIASAQYLAVRVVGTRQIATYEAADLAPTFIANLRSFQDEFMN